MDVYVFVTAVAKTYLIGLSPVLVPAPRSIPGPRPSATVWSTPKWWSSTGGSYRVFVCVLHIVVVLILLILPKLHFIFAWCSVDFEGVAPSVTTL